MKPISKARYMGVVLFLLSANFGYSQWSDGPFLSIGGQVGIPFVKKYNTYSWAGGGVGKLSIPLGTKDYFTVSINALSMNGKSKVSGEKMKEHDILSGFAGYRYDFRKEDSYNYFFVEPQIGWTFSGTDYNTMSVMPMVGYSLNAKIDFAVWYHSSTTAQSWPKIGVAGVMIAYNFHFARRADD